MVSSQHATLGFLCIAACLATPVSGGLVYLIRHGEKNWVLGCLSPKGQERAQDLIQRFSGPAAAFETPKAIFANRYLDLINCERCIQLVTPLSQHLGLQLDTWHGYNPLLGGNHRAAKDIKGALRTTGGPVLAAWEHFNIQFLAEELGVNKSYVPWWPDSDYDSVYVLEFDDQQNLVSFSHQHEDIHPAGAAQAAVATAVLEVPDAATTNMGDSNLATAGSSTVYVIRHGEKDGLVGCLSAQGQARAQNLIEVFSAKQSPNEIFQTPKAVFANQYADGIDCERCVQTATPISEALQLPLDSNHGYNPNFGGNAKAAEAIMSALKTTGGPVLAAWEHINIQYLVEALGVDSSMVPTWAGSDYDSVYVLEFDTQQVLTSFRHAHQDFQPPSSNMAADFSAGIELV